MCGRFVNLNSINKVKNKFDIKNILFSKKDFLSYNISPSQNVNIILKNKFLSIESVNWGIQFFDKTEYKNRKLINSRLETINKKIIFKDSFIDKRCLIPANGYYEWTFENNIKIPYFFQIPNLETIYFAGIWKNSVVGGFKKKTFSIITKNAHISIKHIHQRMPLILSFEEANKFIDNCYNFPKQDFISDLENILDYFPVSNFVNSQRNNSIKCIEPLKYL